MVEKSLPTSEEKHRIGEASDAAPGASIAGESETADEAWLAYPELSASWHVR
jgi:hypothetical protein